MTIVLPSNTSTTVASDHAVDITVANSALLVRDGV